jgi:16S rRNA (cytidine1402-2'-O)-methyltransferase
MKLISALSIETTGPMRSCHQHNEARRVAEALAVLERGEDVVLVSDAGVPVVSDPGAILVEAVHNAGFDLRVIPGPSAVSAALSVSGFSAVPHAFFGFAPRKGKARQVWLDALLSFGGTAVCFEAPSRTARLVADLAEICPTRVACLCRELSKLHEEVRRESLAGLASELADRTVKGEVTLVIGPGPGPADTQEETERVLRGQGAAAAALAEAWGAQRQTVYRALSALKDELE